MTCIVAAASERRRCHERPALSIAPPNALPPPSFARRESLDAMVSPNLLDALFAGDVTIQRIHPQGSGLADDATAQSGTASTSAPRLAT
ncbi:Hypothetical protein A7982_03997 [Minicystis rosea]|nr:Hypothetical protein A7982_03997 [Minicystis rosea]